MHCVVAGEAAGKVGNHGALIEHTHHDSRGQPMCLFAKVWRIHMFGEEGSVHLVVSFA